MSTENLDPTCEKALADKDIVSGDADVPGSGTVHKVGDLDIYVVGEGPRCIILIYDIFGFAPVNTRQNCERLAAKGFMVVMPDLFRGSGRRTEGFQPPSPGKADREILDIVMPFSVKHGARVFGILGFCWGGGCAMRLARSGRFAAAGGIHAAYIKRDSGENFLDVTKALCPIMLLQAGNDPSLSEVNDALRGLEPTSMVARHSVLRTYWDMNHGWCGATGERNTDARIRAATESALVTTIEFFSRTLRFMNAD